VNLKKNFLEILYQCGLLKSRIIWKEDILLMKENIGLNIIHVDNIYALVMEEFLFRNKWEMIQFLNFNL